MSDVPENVTAVVTTTSACIRSLGQDVITKKMLRKLLRPDCVGWAFSAITICALTWTLYNLRTLPDCWAKPRHRTDVGGSSDDPTIMVDDLAARALHRRVRVLCWLPSTKARLDGALQAVNETWGRRCDGRVYFVDAGHTANDVVDVGGLDGYDNLSSKSAAALKYLYHHHLHHYDWFVKAQDDTYVIVENLKLLLSHYNASSPVHLGTGYLSDNPPGGASYVLSREALRRVNEEGYRKNRCLTYGGHEDKEVARCLQNVGVATHNTRDRFGRNTFHPLSPRGRDCCSELTVSFHKLDAELMRVFDRLLYRTSVYGRLQDLTALSGLISPGVVRQKV